MMCKWFIPILVLGSPLKSQYPNLVLGAPLKHQQQQQPNIVWFLTDDQDQMLGGSFPQLNGHGPMPKTKELMAQKGATAERFYIHTPICNPSRSELLSGRYFHNIKMTATPWANMHVNETLPHNHSFMRVLHDQGGYSTGLFGKFMNAMPKSVPPGYDAWMANGGGNYVAPSFQLFNTEGLVPGLLDDPLAKCWGPAVSGQEGYGCFTGSSDPSNYTTAIVGNVSMAWIEKVVQEDPAKPFFAYIAPKAAHEPFNPAPWYEGVWDPSWPQQEPRPETWNCSKESRANHHGVVAKQPLLTAEAAAVVTGAFKNRWRTLMSVDDVIADVIALCERLGVVDNTYFFFSSDHGFQLGEFNILMDKRQVYDFDTRIHLLALGPGIPAASTWDEPATQVDMAPTFLGLAGLDRPSGFDGRSLVPLLIPDATSSDLPVSTRQHLDRVLGTDGNRSMYKKQWRNSVFFEYYYNDANIKCVDDCTRAPLSKQYPLADSNCGDLTPGLNAVCWGGKQCSEGCYATESQANNFIAIRTMPQSPFGDLLYAEFQSGNQALTDIDFAAVDFVEMFNNTDDPWQLRNLIPNTDLALRDLAVGTTAEIHAALRMWFACAGDSCA